MKKIILSIFFFLPILSFAQRINRIKEVRNYAFNEVVYKDSTRVDSVLFFKSIDSLFVAYKVKAIYFVNNGGEGPSQFLFGNIFINIDSKKSIIDMLTGELAHAEQYARLGMLYYAKAAGPIAGAFFRSIFEREKYKAKCKAEADSLMHQTGRSAIMAYWWIAYKSKTYKKPRSLEYEAHDVIEPIIRRLLWGPPK